MKALSLVQKRLTLLTLEKSRYKVKRQLAWDLCTFSLKAIRKAPITLNYFNKKALCEKLVINSRITPPNLCFQLPLWRKQEKRNKKTTPLSFLLSMVSAIWFDLCILLPFPCASVWVSMTQSLSLHNCQI